MYIKKATNRQSQLDELGKVEADQRVMAFKRCECEHTEHHSHQGERCSEVPGEEKFYCRGINGGVRRICAKCYTALLTAHSRSLIA